MRTFAFTAGSSLSGTCPVRAACLALLLVSTCSGIAPAAESERPPNIVFILADDLGWADLGCYGADLHETPHIDALARSGVRFTNAYASAPICSPTRAALLTGTHPARLHMTIWREAAKRPVEDRKLIPPVVEEDLPRSHPWLLPRLLKRSGYHTAHIGKWHLGDSGHYPEVFDFDVHLAGSHWGAPPTYFYPYRGPFSKEKEIRYVPGLHWGKKGEYLTDRLTDEAVRFIERAEQPFFLNLWHHAVHTPMEGKQKDVDYFRQKLRPEMKHRNPTFAAMLRSLDQSVGRILKVLEDRGLAGNTLVIFTSDNGGFLGGPDRFITTNVPLRSGKGSLYEGGIRVPLIVRLPDVTPAGSLCNEPVVSVDLHSTLLEIAASERAEASAGGVREADDAQRYRPEGLSLVPLLKDPSAKLEQRTLYWHYPHYYPTSTPCGAIRMGDLKLIEFFEDNHVELYNLRDDLAETKDLAAVKPDEAKSLRDELAKWREQVRAQMPVPNPKFAKQ